MSLAQPPIETATYKDSGTLSKRERGFETHVVGVGRGDLVDGHSVDGSFAIAAVLSHVRPQC